MKKKKQKQKQKKNKEKQSLNVVDKIYRIYLMRKIHYTDTCPEYIGVQKIRE